MKNFIKYWQENFKVAKDWFDFAMFGWFGVSVVFAIAYWINGTHNPFGEFVEEHKLDTVAGISAGFVFFCYGLVWLPYKRHEIEKNRPTEKDAQISELKKELQKYDEIKNRELVEHDREIFKELSQIVNTAKVDGLASTLSNRTYYNNSVLLPMLLDFGTTHDSQFFIKSLEFKYSLFHASYVELRYFVRETFKVDVYGTGQFLPGFDKAAEGTKERQQYVDGLKKLAELSDNLKATYQDFREAVKTTLSL